MPAERQAELRQRFADGSAKLAAARIFEQLEAAAGVSQRDFSAAVQAYFSQGVACPFLEQESCSIHADRPIACREYLVTSPAERCASASGEGVDNVAHVFKVKEALIAASAAEQPAGHLGFVPMIRALEWSRSNPEPVAERSAEDWLNDLFRRMHALL